jgi:hypothetical protein
VSFNDQQSSVVVQRQREVRCVSAEVNRHDRKESSNQQSGPAERPVHAEFANV